MVVVEHLECPGVTNVTQEQCVFTTLRLLNFNMYAAEEKYKISFRPEMFRVPCPKGLEAILYFLLTKLDPERAKMELDPCWPTYDAKRDHTFRKHVFNWLNELSRDVVEGVNIPRINSSLLTKASGTGVISLLQSLSSLVLANSIKSPELKERAGNMPRYHAQKPHLNLATAECLRLETEALKRMITTKGAETAVLRSTWGETARNISEGIESLTRKRKVLTERASVLDGKQRNYAKLITEPSTKPGDDQEHLKCVVQQKSSTLRSRIKKITEVYGRRVQERLILNSLVTGSSSQNVIDQDKIVLQVPSILVQEYQKQLNQGKIGNTYVGGDLNLVTLTKLGYISLKHLLSSMERDNAKCGPEKSVVRTEHARLSETSQNLAELWDSLGRLLEDTKRFNILLGKETGHALGTQVPDELLPFQSPMPIFSLEGATGSYTPTVRYHLMTPVDGGRRSRAGLTPVSFRKYRLGNGKRLSEVEDKENVKSQAELPQTRSLLGEGVVKDLNETFEGCSSQRSSLQQGLLVKQPKDGFLSREFNDLSLFDVSGNLTNLSIFDEENKT